MSQINVDTIKKADGTGSLTVPAESGTVVVKDGSNDVTLNNITATGVYLGGTGAANYLDDFEEGTWSPSIGGHTGGTVYGTYTKIKNQVTVTVHMMNQTLSGASGTGITNLPFTPSDRRSTTSAVGHYNLFAYDTVFGLVELSNPTITMLKANANSGWSAAPFSNGSGRYLHFSATYFV